jgi:D-inositol-3-phosphate glycosyltransferase
MKIALLGPCSTEIGPGRADQPLAGGVDAVVLALARSLAARQDLELSVVTAPSGLTQPAQHPGDGFMLYCVPRPRGGRLTGQRPVVENLRAQLIALAPDIVHAHSAGIYAGGALASGLPAVVTLHGIIGREARQAWATSSWPDRLRWWADARFERGVVRRARDIIAISPYVLAEFQAYTTARFHLIENPVDDRYFAAAAPLPGRSRLLCVARAIPRKGIATLVEAFALAAEAWPAASLIIVGETTSDPTYVARCRQLAVDLGVAGRVVFTGALSPDAIVAHHAAADGLVLASEQETAPVTIAEAMAMGRPVVATDVGGCAAMVADGLTGLIVPPRDPQALAGAMGELLADPARCAALGKAGRAVAEARFRLSAVTDATLAVYRSILEGA